MNSSWSMCTLRLRHFSFSARRRARYWCDRTYTSGLRSYIVMAYIVMAYIAMAYIVMAYVAMAYIVMAYVVMA